MLIDALSLKFKPDDYRAKLPVFDYLADLGSFKLRRPVTVFVGENGIGKSSLLAGVASDLGCSPEGGRMDDPDEIVPRSPIRCVTDKVIQRAYFLRAEKHEYLIARGDSSDERAGRSTLSQNVDLSRRSHGQSVFDMLYEHINGQGVYVLDEPESGLSVIRQLALVGEIAQAVDRGAQIIIATHSPILLACPGADIVELNDTGFERIAFDEAEAVAATRELLADPDPTIRFIVNPE